MAQSCHLATSKKCSEFGNSPCTRAAPSAIARLPRCRDAAIGGDVESGAGDPALLRADEKELEPDITNTTTRQVFEIKNEGQEGLEAGREEVRGYRDALNRAAPANAKFKLGTGEQGELFGAFKGGAVAWHLTWRTTEPGVIQYSLKQRKRDKEANAETYEHIPWVDITEAELEQYGDEFLEQIDVEEERDAKMEADLERDLSRLDIAMGIFVVVAVALILWLGKGLIPVPTRLAPLPPVRPPIPPMRPPIGIRPPPPAPPPVQVQPPL